MTKRAILIALLLAACTKVESENILTSGLYASLGATAEGDGQTDVWATLYLGEPINLDFIELTANDELVATVDGVEKTMTELEFLNIVTYGATFDVDAEDTGVNIAFFRTVDDGAPSSTCTMPAPFEIVAFPADPVSRASEIAIDWDASGTADRLRWEANGDCIQLASGGVTGDPGTVSIAANTFVKLEGDNVPDECNVTVTIFRERDGDLDPGYGEGGTITCRQVRSVTFQSVP